MKVIWKELRKLIALKNIMRILCIFTVNVAGEFYSLSVQSEKFYGA